MSEEIEKHVYRRYEILSKLGKGAYGIVWKAVDKKTRKTLALKKCFDAFRNATDAQRTYREIQYLKHLEGHDNIVRLIDVLKAENDKDVYLTFDYMETDLHAVIRAGILEDIHKQYVIYQLLKALKYIHSAELLHRDVKPSNLLLNSDCHLKVCDFGLCRSIAEKQGPNPVLTDYVATRWYRAPEILLGSTSYTKGVDVWSVGCILGEMLHDKPVFPGTSTMNQLEKIIEVTGAPTREDKASIQSPFADTMLQSIPTPPQVSLSALLPKASAPAIDMMTKCLMFSPAARPTVVSLLEMEYVAQFHQPQNPEPTAKSVCNIAIDDNTKMTADDYRKKIYKDINMKKKSKLKQRRGGGEANGGAQAALKA